MYRPPTGDVHTFFHVLENVLSFDDLNGKEIWILGDFNINFLKRTDKSTKLAIEFARVCGFQQLIQSATHLTGFGKSCIDLIFTNCEFVCSSGVLDDVVSDHFPIYACIKKQREVHSFIKIQGRTYTNYHKESFQLLMQNDDWTGLYHEADPNIIWDLILNRMNSHLEVMCPKTYLKVNNNKPYWLTHHIIESINDRNTLFRRAKISGIQTDLQSARTARNRTNKLVNSSKEEFIKESLETNRNDPKKFWRIINNTIIKKPKSSDQTNILDSHGHSLSYEDSCYYMNEYLTSVGDDLRKQFANCPPPNQSSFEYYNRVKLDHTYIIQSADVIKILKDIDNSKGSGIEFIPTFIIKDAFECISHQVAYMMNQTLQTGVFPDKWAQASVIPIPKAGDPHMVKNWRPISILPLPGKILEKICTNYLMNDLKINNILSDYQFGFRSGLSTSHAVFHYIKCIIDGINNRGVTAAVYLDFARAFDSVDHEILLLKLYDMGVSKILIRWIQGYLRNRHIVTKFNGFISPPSKVTCGVPQGSVIGPILFLCFINDITHAAHENGIKISLYADDAVVYITSNDQTTMQVQLQAAVTDVDKWCSLNRINLNVSKTKMCCYGTRHHLENFEIKLKLNDCELGKCKQYTYLGVILDETMNLASNFNATFKKFSYKIFQFSKIRKYLPPDVRVLVYKQTVLPMVEYISYLLYINRKHDVDKLQKLQNRALRLCFDIIDPMSVSVCQLHTQAQIGMLEPRRDVQLLGLLYDMRSDTRYLRDTIINTRLADRIVFSVDRVNYEIYRRSPYYVGHKLWNNLDMDVQMSRTKSLFKSRIKLLN